MGETVKAAVARQRGDDIPKAEPDGGAVLAVLDSQQWWSPRQLAALSALGIRTREHGGHATNEDLLVFLHYCAKARLDPFSKQIYLLERRSKVNNEWVYTQTIQVGIDGYRVVAQRAAKREGVHIEYARTIWYDDDGNEVKAWLKATPPAAAEVTVIKVMSDGTKLRYPGFVRFDAYAAYGRTKDGDRYLMAQWGVMPDHMIEKCAESYALRRAFPNDLGGIYIEEENQSTASGLPQPPRLSARRAEPEGGEEFVVPGATVPPDTGEDGTRDVDGEQEPPADPPPSPPMDRKRASARLLAIFREHGLGAAKDAKLRQAVVGRLLNVEPVHATEMGDEQVIAAAVALERVCDEAEVQSQDVNAVLRNLANGQAS
jgi:phage recombination protein Bet